MLKKIKIVVLILGVIACLSFIAAILFTAREADANQLTSTDTNNNQAAGGGGGGASASNGNQNQVVTIVVPPQPRVITKIYYRTKTKKVQIYHYNPNRLQLLIGASKTKQEIGTNACGCSLSATRVYEPDLGLQYLRDFGSFTGSITATKNESIYIGLGFNW